MASPDESRPKPVLTVSWPRLPGRKIGRKHREFDLCAIAGIVVRAATWFGWFIGVNQIMCCAESNQLIS
jgi:hypothetical protein